MANMPSFERERLLDLRHRSHETRNALPLAVELHASLMYCVLAGLTAATHSGEQ